MVSVPILDTKYMQLCLELAKKGYGKVSPNPLVGCVIVKKNKIIAKGFHKYFGGPHAEVVALKNLPKTYGATMYVNLEPCSHWGKTPPCTDMIIKAGISRVVIGMKDPNPKVCGIKQLKRKNIKLKIGVLENESKELNKTYIKFVTTGKPYVILKSAMSLDGKIATKTGDSKWITSKKAREYVYSLRTKVDAILVGINTILKDDPVLTTHGRKNNPLRVVIDPELVIPLKAKVINNDANTLVVTSSGSSKIDILNKKGVQTIVLRDSSRKTSGSKNNIINFQDIMKKLAEMSISSVLIEGGGETNALALKSGIVDELQFFIAPKIIGGNKAKTPVEGTGINYLNQAMQLKDISVEKFGQDILIRGVAS